MSAPWTQVVEALAVPFGAAVIGAVTGGMVTWTVGRAESRRVRRERYGQALLDALGSARVATQRARSVAYASAAADAIGQPPEDEEIVDPLVLRQEARDILVNAELAATLERRPDQRRSIEGWALHHHEALLAGCEDVDDLQRMDDQLKLGEFLVVAWMAGRARGRDFSLGEHEVIDRFGPKYTTRHTPDYAVRPPLEEPPAGANRSDAGTLP